MQRASGIEIETDSISSSSDCAILERTERTSDFHDQRLPQPFLEEVSSRSVEILEVLNTMFNNLEQHGTPLLSTAGRAEQPQSP